MADYDLIVIGAGPGGYVAAIRAAQLGLKTACVEREPQLGGTCLRVGCIPSKALLESSEQFVAAQKSLADHGVKLGGQVTLDLETMLARKDKTVDGLTKGVAGLFKKNDVDTLKGHATFTGPGEIVVQGDDGEQKHAAKHFIIATGSVSAALPGIDFDGDLIGDSTTALSYPSVPKRLVVIGAGYIGLELGSVWQRLGSQVTVLEYLDRILPGLDADIAKEAHKLFKRQGLTFELSTKVTGAKVTGKGKQKQCVVECEGRDPIECDRVLVAVGRKPNTENLGLEAAGVQVDDRGRIDVDEHYRTTADNIYAIGDVIVGPMLAHKAEEEGVVCVERIVRGSGHVNYDAIPGVVYTHPEIAGVGKTEEQLKEAGTEYKVGTFHFRGNGRARALGEIDGKVKILAHAQTDRILGVHIIGARAGDLIAEAAVAIEFGASAEDLARTSHAHPTLAECLKEAAMAVNDGAIHA
jgi:dihydrolipoamide dehydrogenase